MLLSDPSDRVALQIALLIANMARFDVPRPWATLLPDLAAASGPESTLGPAPKTRALKALKHAVRSLRGGSVRAELACYDLWCVCVGGEREERRKGGMDEVGFVWAQAARSGIGMVPPAPRLCSWKVAGVRCG